MFTSISLITANIFSLVFLLVLLVILATAARLKCSIGWFALLIATTSVPTYCTVLALMLAPAVSVYFVAAALTLNLLFMPLLWYSVHFLLNSSFRISWRVVLHVLPAIVSCVITIVYYSNQTLNEITVNIQNLLIRGANTPLLINNVFFLLQLLYFPCVIRFVYNWKKLCTQKKTCSEQEYFNVYWLPKVLPFVFAIVCISALCYLISPFVALWVNPLLHIVGMAYLTYYVIKHSFIVPPSIAVKQKQRLAKLPETEKQEPAADKDDEEYMKEISQRVLEHLQSTQAYKNSELVLAEVAKELNVHQKKISAAINSYLNKNFFELVNTLRVEEAKQQLLSLNTNITVESVYPECGFNSRSSFYAVFRKIEGTTPAKWLENQRNRD